jgi:hypothetical protein
MFEEPQWTELMHYVPVGRNVRLLLLYQIFSQHRYCLRPNGAWKLRIETNADTRHPFEKQEKTEARFRMLCFLIENEYLSSRILLETGELE